MTDYIKPPGSIPATTPPGQPLRPIVQVPTPLVPPKPVGAVNSPGIGPGFALADHVHADRDLSGGGGVTPYVLTIEQHDFSTTTGTNQSYSLWNNSGTTVFFDPFSMFDASTGLITLPVGGNWQAVFITDGGMGWNNGGDFTSPVPTYLRGKGFHGFFSDQGFLGGTWQQDEFDILASTPSPFGTNWGGSAIHWSYFGFGPVHPRHPISPAIPQYFQSPAGTVLRPFHGTFDYSGSLQGYVLGPGGPYHTPLGAAYDLTSLVTLTCVNQS